MTAFVPQVGCVDFNHHRGPEIEFWVTEDGQKLYDHNDWSLLPFMALSDGVHALVEDFSYFTLLQQPGLGNDEEKPSPAKEGEAAAPRPGASTLFGVACTRQIRSDRLRNRSKSVTRASVQKSVVVVVDGVSGLGDLRTRLGMVTEMWFAQEDFTDTTILKEFQESLVRTSAQGTPGNHFFGLSLREVIHEFRHQTLVLVKCLLLQRKMLFFSSKCERLCLLQFALLSLLPGLTSHLDTAAHPDLDTTERLDSSAKKSARAELLESFGQPLRIFSRGSFFSPYTPLQHLDMLAAYSTKSYVVGSTNSLLLQQQSRYADIMVNLDTEPYSITIFSPSLKQASVLSAADRRWIDNLTQQVLDTWDPENPARPKNLGYAGSEEMIRLQFEEYILSLCSSMAYQVYKELTDGTVKDVLWKDEGQESGVISTKDERDAPELQEISTEENPPEKPPRPGSTSSNVVAQPASQAQPHHHHHSQPHHNHHRTHLRTSSLDAHLPPADLTNNALDFNPEFLASWRSTRSFELFIASLPLETLTSIDPSSTSGADASKRPRIFDLIPPSHMTSGGLNIDDVQRRLQQGFEDFRVTYKVDERLGQTKENVGKAIEVGRERWAKWWTEMEERRRRGGKGEDEGGAATTTDSKENSRPGSLDGRAVTDSGPSMTPATTASKTTDGTKPSNAIPSAAGGGGGAWTAAIRERAAKVQQIQKPDTTALQHAAKENAARAGAYLSSWGSWAKEKSRDWQAGGTAGAPVTAPTAKKEHHQSQSAQLPGRSAVPSAPSAPSAPSMPPLPSVGAGNLTSAPPTVKGTGTGTGTAADGTGETTAKPQRQSIGKFKEDID